jgi:hypothetical protein
MIGFLPLAAGDPSPMLGPLLLGPPYGGALGLPMPVISYSPPTPGSFLPIATVAARTVSSHSAEVKGQ